MTQLDVETFLDEFSEPVRALARDLIDVISAEVPEAPIGVRTGWRCVAFTHPRVGYFAGVFLAEAEVRVGFEFGVLLRDPTHSLTGAGSQMRYLNVPLGTDAPSDNLRVLVEQAISLPAEASVRRMMVRELAGEH